MIVHVLEDLKVTQWNIAFFWHQLPLFFMGVAFSDIESMKDWRPLDAIRDLGLGMTLLRNTILLTIFFLFGSLNKYGCYNEKDEACPLFNFITLDSHLPFWMAIYIGALAIFVLALVSPAF